MMGSYGVGKDGTMVCMVTCSCCVNAKLFAVLGEGCACLVYAKWLLCLLSTVKHNGFVTFSL
jgi:hypothetical protein